MFSPKIDKYHELSGDSTFSSIGATIADNFNVELPEFGKSYLNEMGLNINESALFIRFSFWNSWRSTFTNERSFRNIVPEYLPLRKTAVLVTGVFEIFFGIMLLLKRPANWLKQV